MRFLRRTVQSLLLRSQRAPVSRLAMPWLEPLETRALLTSFGPPAPVPPPEPAPQMVLGPTVAGQNGSAAPDRAANDFGRAAPPGFAPEGIWHSPLGESLAGGSLAGAPGLFESFGPPPNEAPPDNAPADHHASPGAIPPEGSAAVAPLAPLGSLDRNETLPSAEPSPSRGNPLIPSADPLHPPVSAAAPGNARALPLVLQTAGGEGPTAEAVVGPARGSATAGAGGTDSGPDPEGSPSFNRAALATPPAVLGGMPTGLPTGLPAQADVVKPVWFGAEPFLALRQLIRSEVPDGWRAALTRVLLSPALASAALALTALALWRRRGDRRGPSATELPGVTGPSGL